MSIRANEVAKFRCRYTLDEQVDRESVELCQSIYRFLQSALESKIQLPLDAAGFPEAVPYYLVYAAAIVYGAADAAVTLVLHNLAREARLFDRQIFECWIRAKYYVDHPQEARVAMFSTPFGEKRILDELKYDQTSPRYIGVVEGCDIASKTEPESVEYREPAIKTILSPQPNEGLRRLYALQYRVPSQMAHATFAGVGGVWKNDTLSFDSRESLPTYLIGTVTIHLLAFLQLLSEALKLDIEKELGRFNERRVALEPRMFVARDETDST